MSTVNPYWSELPWHLLASIAKRLALMEDFVAFRGVCVSWRDAATKDCCNRSLPKIPILMLAEKSDSDDREFFSLSKGKMWFKMALPETKGKRCIESKGWLITLECKGEMHLLHPFSRVQIQLPNISTTMDYDAEHFDQVPHVFMLCAVLSCSPFESDDYAVMISGASLALDFWRPGDKFWTRIHVGRTYLFSNLSFFKGGFYAINYEGKIWLCDISGSDVPRARVITRIDEELYQFNHAYLVESFGELLVVFRNGRCMNLEDDYGATHFDVIRLDFNEGQCGWTVMNSLGDMSLFVGHNSSFAINAKCFEGIKSNCIYFTDDAYDAYEYFEYGGGKDMGIYHLENGEIERLPDFQSFSKISPPIWIAPYF